MNSLSPQITKKINSYVNHLFSSNAKSNHDIKEIKDEIKAHMLTEVQELISNGKTEAEALALVKRSVGSNNDLTPLFPSYSSSTKAPALLRLTYILYVIYGSLEIILRLGWEHIFKIGFSTLRIISSYSPKIFVISTVLFLIWTIPNQFSKFNSIKFKLLNLLICCISMLQCYIFLKISLTSILTYEIYNLTSILSLTHLILYFLAYTKKVIKLN